MGVSYNQCINAVESFGGLYEITSEGLDLLKPFCEKIGKSEGEEVYGEPLVWIGIYITIASWFCILAMSADLLNGFKRRKTWFPCKYFSLNAASVTVIAVAMKLPMDLSSAMHGHVDQAAKIGSMAFMCTMMANFMPSLASMDNKTLAANVTGLVILVITMIVNVCIEISTSNISDHFSTIAIMYITITILLLVILISSAITIPTYKQILEMKYQATSEKALNDQHSQHTAMTIVEKLRRYVTRYWVMAETGSPQFVMAINPLSFASGVICVLGVVIYIFFLLPILLNPRESHEHGSQYKSTTHSILVSQFIGVMVGAIAPIFRCYMVLKWRILMILKVEEYWTQKLYEWKESDVHFLSSNPRSRALVHNLKIIIINLWIRFQKVVVVSCKIVVILVVYCSYCWKSLRAMFSTTSIESSGDNTNEDVSGYVLQLGDEIRPTQETLISISKSFNHFMQKVEKKQTTNVLNLVEKSTGFEGVKYFDDDQVQLLFSPRLVNSWSLPVVSLTCIAITLPSIRKGMAHSLFTSVRDSLFYTHMVEECLNTAGEYVNIQRATVALWREVEDDYKWLENTLEKRAFKEKRPFEILKWFVDKAQEIVTEITNKSFNGEPVDNPPKKLIVANSMYRVAQTILFNNQSDIGSQELFDQICSMIADILAACLTNIPRVIMLKFNESAIDKCEASVEAAAKLLGRTTEIITRLEARQPPRMDPNKMAFIDEWRLHLNQP